MENVKFIYNLDSYRRSNGAISDFGEIYLKADSFCFPEEGWTDFGCKAVYIWSQEFINLLNTNQSKAECNFYDGAFLFYINKTDKEVWEIMFVDEDSNKHFERKFYVNPIQISIDLLDALKFMKEIRLSQGDQKSVTYFQDREIELVAAIDAWKTN